MTSRAIVTLICFYFFALPITSVVAANDIKNIKNLYKKTNKIIANGKIKKLFYYNTDDGWKTTVNPKGLGFKDVGEGRMLEQTSLYTHEGVVVKAVLHIDTPSGDWANKREYYFYHTGKTAFLFESHFTFSGQAFDSKKPLPKGPYIVERRIYFDTNGKEIRRLEKAFTSKTKQPILARFFRQIDPVIIMNVNRLSFYGPKK